MLFFIRPLFDDFSWEILGNYATLDPNLPNTPNLPWWNHIWIPDDNMADMFENFDLVLVSY